GLDPVIDPVRVLSRIGYLSEEPDLPGWMRIDELLRYVAAFYPTWDMQYAEQLRQQLGLDPIVRRDILGAIVRTIADEGRTVLFSSHLLAEVERVSDRVAMIRGGRIEFYDSIERVKQAHAR